MATTSVNIAHRDSICRSACSSAVSLARYPNIIPQRTTLASFRRKHLAQSYQMIVETIDIVENDIAYRNLQPKC